MAGNGKWPVVEVSKLGIDPPAEVKPLSIELIYENLPERREGRISSFAPLQSK